MATTPNVPVTEKPKNLYTVTVEYQSADGSFKSATSEREFTVPDNTGEITVNVMGDDGKTQTQVKREFRKNGLIAASPQDLLRILESNPFLAVAAYNYGADLFARNVIKGPISTEVEGPGKAIAKMADQIFNSRAKLGKPITKEKALALAQAMADAEA